MWDLENSVRISLKILLPLLVIIPVCIVMARELEGRKIITLPVNKIVYENVTLNEGEEYSAYLSFRSTSIYRGVETDIKDPKGITLFHYPVSSNIQTSFKATTAGTYSFIFYNDEPPMSYYEKEVTIDWRIKLHQTQGQIGPDNYFTYILTSVTIIAVVYLTYIRKNKLRQFFFQDSYLGGRARLR